DTGLQWARIAEQLREVRGQFGRAAPGGARRTEIAEDTIIEAPDLDSMIAREPVTVILSKMGWVRALRGHQPLDAELKFRDGDGPFIALHAETTDKLVIAGQNG